MLPIRGRELTAVDAYRALRTIRTFEERCLELSHDGVVEGSIHLCLGQEAIPTGVASMLRSDDRVFATYRGHGWALACGAPLVDVLAEICHREAGCNGGRAGSAYLSYPDVGFLGENSIVGAGVPLAAGVALASATRSEGAVAVVSIGDGAMNQGSVHEGLAFAAYRQLPLVIVCENNGWSEMTPISATTMVVDLADRAAAYGIHGEVVDGCDVFAVADAAHRAIATARAGAGPTLLECKTVRLSGHYNRDIEHYRPAHDKDDAERRDPLRVLRERVLQQGHATSAELDTIDVEIDHEIDDATEFVLDLPRPSASSALDHVDAVQPLRSSSPNGPATELTYQRAINQALRDELSHRPDLLVYGEDVGVAGGIFGVTRSLQKDFGLDRVFDTPISESAILGSAVGAAMVAMRPVVEIMWADFLLVALDQLVNQAANVRYVNRGRLTAPIVVRLQQGSTPGSCAQHSQSLEAILAHIPGLKVGVISTPDDAYSMTRAAIADPDPCVLIENRALYQRSGPVHLTNAVEVAGGARWHGHGNDLTIVTWGAMVNDAVDAAHDLAASGIAAGVLDLRWLRPLDDDALVDAVERGGGRVLVVHEANLTGGFGAEVVARIQARSFAQLTAAVARLGAPDVRIPASPVLRTAVIPDAAAIAAGARVLATEGAIVGHAT